MVPRQPLLLEEKKKKRRKRPHNGLLTSRLTHPYRSVHSGLRVSPPNTTLRLLVRFFLFFSPSLSLLPFFKFHPNPDISIPRVQRFSNYPPRYFDLQEGSLRCPGDTNVNSEHPTEREQGRRPCCTPGAFVVGDLSVGFFSLFLFFFFCFFFLTLTHCWLHILRACCCYSSSTGKWGTV